MIACITLCKEFDTWVSSDGKNNFFRSNVRYVRFNQNCTTFVLYEYSNKFQKETIK